MNKKRLQIIPLLLSLCLQSCLSDSTLTLKKRSNQTNGGGPGGGGKGGRGDQNDLKDTLRFGNRTFVISKLKNIFGHAFVAVHANRTNNGILVKSSVYSERIKREISAFGGPCDPSLKVETYVGNSYEEKKNDGLPNVYEAQESIFENKEFSYWHQDSEYLFCDMRSDSQASIFTGPSLTKSALTLRACDMILLRDPAPTNSQSQGPINALNPNEGNYSTDLNVRIAATRARYLAGKTTAIADDFGNNAITQSSLSSAPDEADIKGAWELFFPGKPISSLELETLKKVVKDATDKSGGFDGWRFLFYTQCMIPDWQIP